MSINLPEAVENYIRRANAHDADGVADCFGADAQVRDEGHIHRGREAIRAWAGATSASYAAISTAVACESTAVGCIVTSEVTGNFPGSPLCISFDFKLGADGIDALEITA